MRRINMGPHTNMSKGPLYLRYATGMCVTLINSHSSLDQIFNFKEAPYSFQ
jgi:hypothetical protein